MNHSKEYRVYGERKALEIIFNFLWLDLLTNPEGSLASDDSVCIGNTVLSREQNTLPSTYEEFRRKVVPVDWDALYCVAGTDLEDERRVVLIYTRNENLFMLNFPVPGKLSENEKQIAAWIDQAMREGNTPSRS